MRNFYKIYGVIWVSFMTSFFNTVNRPLSEAALPEVGAGAAGAPGSTRAPGAGPRPRRLGKQTWRCLASLHQKSIFSMKHVFKNREKKSNKTPRYFCPLQSQPADCQFLIPPSLLFFGVLSPLSTYMGWGSGWVGALGVRGSPLLLGWGLLLPFSPPLPHHTAPHLSLRVSHLAPQKSLCLSLCCVCCWFFFGFGFFVFFTILRSLCSRRSYYILLKKWGGGKPRGHCAFIKKQNKVCTLFFRFCISWVCAVLRGWQKLPGGYCLGLPEGDWMWVSVMTPPT